MQPKNYAQATGMITEKQIAALRAVAEDQKTTHSLIWWANARASWQGPRRTLGSLYVRGLVDYSDEDSWSITDAGRAALAEQS